jgi:hypothetical protein
MLSSIRSRVTLSVVAGNWYFWGTEGGTEIVTSGSRVSAGTACPQACGAAQASTVAAIIGLTLFAREPAARLLRLFGMAGLPEPLCRQMPAGKLRATS